MLMQKDFLNKLKDFGLNTYEARLWTALLSRGVSTAGELSDISNVPRSRTYDVLESLEKKGFIIMKVGKPIKYIAVHPTEVIERIKKKVMQDAEETSSIISQIKVSKLFDELNLLHSKGIEMIEPMDLSGSFRGRDSIYLHLGSLIKQAKKSILISTTSSGLGNKLGQFKGMLEKASQRGAKVRISAPITKSPLPQLGGSHGIEVRSLKTTGRFCIIDQRDVVLMLMDDKDAHPNYDTAIWLRSPYLATTLSSYFDQEWSNQAR
ncbi:MAG TPA: helix-turn-helix domain-containing protein [Candidatus Nanoarchaeia archaeon]|nr:helix-turn-helix domain-containing protein [Candidatus Nanoarchaeia archaeon]